MHLNVAEADADARIRETAASQAGADKTGEAQCITRRRNQQLPAIAAKYFRTR